MTSELGKRYDRWVVVSKSNSNLKGHPKVMCRCDCGTERVVFLTSLRLGRSRSCGCLQKEVAAQMKRTHGMAGSAVYFTFKDMHRRCYDPRHKSYARYGGRGITVCERWHDLAKFVADVGEKPEGKTLDRVDNDKGYGPDNFRWSTGDEQQRNKGANVWFEYEGKRYILADLARFAGHNPTTFKERLKRGWLLDDAVKIPSVGFNRKNPGLHRGL